MAIISSSFCILISSLALLSTVGEGYGDEETRKGGEVKKVLFVFGDSYADTGNLPTSVSRSWKSPYGITFPGKPSGRFSDGRVLTDYIASFLGIRSPFPYRRLKNLNTNTIRYGINFAHGGTGVFQTLQVDQPNMTAQIDFFQQLVDKNVYRSEELSSSIALVSLAGNDYSTYLARHGSFQGLPELKRSVIEQLVLNVRRIKDFEIKKIAITGIEPLGCLPRNSAASSYRNCNAEENNFSQSHNILLQQHIWALNYETAAPVFKYLDLYDAFISALKIDQKSPGNLTDKLKPCCGGAKGEDA
ncbi:GDSL esterase/lipase At5g03610-like [Sesamum indicum]|uniref:GDSL esterase/lipase At5g03610-like n=1 Tax=Sesamum indicum TaxID=4182 RepID=A0A8M8UYR5_SESIN|nr:GDSL esterase/lipase At5g03610-like [Sesamum indicum]